MTSNLLRLLVLLPLFLVLFITERTGSSPQRPLPNPVLYLTGSVPGGFLCALAKFAALRKKH